VNNGLCRKTKLTLSTKQVIRDNCQSGFQASRLKRAAWVLKVRYWNRATQEAGLLSEGQSKGQHCWATSS